MAGIGKYKKGAAFTLKSGNKPSFTQMRFSEAGYYGRKSGKGFFNYSENALNVKPTEDRVLGKKIFDRILMMLINEAVDAVFLNIGSKEAIDLAMTNGVNYPKGLLKWADEIGLEVILEQLENMFAEYGEDRYRPSPLMRRMVKSGEKFFG